MLQWMGGSRRKVTTSRKSTQKRQKQYFEQRKRQQQYQQQPVELDCNDNETDIPEEHHKEHRSLDVISLLNLSKIAQDCRSACPSGTDDIVVDASKQEFDNSKGVPSAFQMQTASPKKAGNSHTNTLNGVNNEPDQWETATEKSLSVLDLLVDDRLDANIKENIPHEAHVAFSVAGLGTGTAGHSSQQPSRDFMHGLSSPIKASGQLNLSKKFNCLLDDLETEVDPRMQDINFPLNSKELDFSSEYTDIFSSPKQKSISDREVIQNDGYLSKRNRYFDCHNEVKREDVPPLQYDGFFDERGPDMPWNTRQSQMEDCPAANLVYRSSDPPEFSFEGTCVPIRDAEKKKDKFNILGSTSPFSEHVTSEYNCDFLASNWSRHQIVERDLDHLHGANQPEHFLAVPEDAKENSSLHSEESCTSTAVRHQATDDSLSNATSRHCRRGRHGIGFSSSGNEYDLKAVAKDRKNDCQPESLSSRIATHKKIFNASNVKAREQSRPFFQENLETKDNWFFEERHTEVDISPGSCFFKRNSGAKHENFDTQQWDKDPFGEFPAPKSQNGTNNQRNGSHRDLAGCKLSGYFTPKIPKQDFPTLSKPELPSDSSLRKEPMHLPFASGYQFVSPDISPQESISKDVECNAKFRPSSYETFELGEEVFIRNETLANEDKVASDASNSMSNEHEGKEAKDQSASRVNTAFLPDLVEKTSVSPEITNISGTRSREKARFRDFDGAYKFSGPYHGGRKENIEDFGTKEKMDYKPKRGNVESPRQEMMLQSYVLQLFCVQQRLKY